MAFRKTQDVPAWLIVGLGNPGRQYEGTWHNCGYMALERFAQRHDISLRRARFKGFYGEGRIKGRRVVLLKPGTYMNRSGESVRAAMDWFKIPAQQVIVLYDDFEIDRGQVRIREKGGAGTHNGMKSIIAHLGTQDFPRFRIGTGPVPEQMDVINFVLGRIPAQEKTIMDEAFGRCADGLDYVLEADIQLAMNRVNQRGANHNGSHKGSQNGARNGQGVDKSGEERVDD